MKGKIAVVTGAGQGIGKAIALALAREGAMVYVVDTNHESALETVSEIVKTDGQADEFTCNVSLSESVDNAVSYFLIKNSRIDILVNCAGITRDKLSVRMTDQEWNDVLAVNLTGTFNFSRAVGRDMMKERNGCIVNIASIMGITGNAGQVNYSASKAGVIALTKSMAKELAIRNIRVNAVAPGFIATAMTEALPEAKRAEIEKMIPMGRHGSADEVAKVVVFLCSDAASYVTGEVIKVDGGLAM